MHITVTLSFSVLLLIGVPFRDDTASAVGHWCTKLDSQLNVVRDCCHGFTRVGDDCQPYCGARGCQNGKCTGSYRCTCDSGYVLISLRVCAPKCQQNCVNGNCTAPDGYRQQSNNSNTCERDKSYQNTTSPSPAASLQSDKPMWLFYTIGAVGIFAFITFMLLLPKCQKPEIDLNVSYNSQQETTNV